MEKHIQIFYRGERVSQLGFACYGLGSICLGLIYYYLTNHELSRGFFTAVASIGLIQICAACVRFYRTLRKYDLALDSANTNNKYLKESETSYITLQLKKYTTRRMILTAAIIAGFVLFGLFWVQGFSKFLLGTIAAIILHACIMLSFDLFNQFRAQEYRHQLGKLDPNYISPFV